MEHLRQAVDDHLAALRKVAVASFFGADEWRTPIDGAGALAPVRDRLLRDLRVSARTVPRRGDTAPSAAGHGSVQRLAGDRRRLPP